MKDIIVGIKSLLESSNPTEAFLKGVKEYTQSVAMGNKTQVRESNLYSDDSPDLGAVKVVEPSVFTAQFQSKSQSGDKALRDEVNPQQEKRGLFGTQIPGGENWSGFVVSGNDNPTSHDSDGVSAEKSTPHLRVVVDNTAKDNGREGDYIDVHRVSEKRSSFVEKLQQSEKYKQDKIEKSKVRTAEFTENMLDIEEEREGALEQQNATRNFQIQQTAEKQREENAKDSRMAEKFDKSWLGGLTPDEGATRKFRDKIAHQREQRGLSI